MDSPFPSFSPHPAGGLALLKIDPFTHVPYWMLDYGRRCFVAAHRSIIGDAVEAPGGERNPVQRICLEPAANKFDASFGESGRHQH